MGEKYRAHRSTSAQAPEYEEHEDDDKWQVANSESFELSLLVFGQYNPSVFLDARADLFVQAKLVSNIVDLGQEENGDCIEPGRDPN
jgi:hypothetical protein